MGGGRVRKRRGVGKAAARWEADLKLGLHRQAWRLLRRVLRRQPGGEGGEQRQHRLCGQGGAGGDPEEHRGQEQDGEQQRCRRQCGQGGS